MEVAAESIDLSSFRVARDFDEVYYIPDFLSADEQSRLSDKVYGSAQWTVLGTTGRRLQQWGGSPDAKLSVVSPLPAYLEELSSKIYKKKFVSAQPNHVLINEYLPGQGIMPHEDGPLYTGNFAIISLLSPLLLDFYRKRTESELEKEENDAKHDGSTALEARRVFSLWLEPGSLLLIRGFAYTSMLHGIRDVTEDVIDDKVCNLREGDNLHLRGTTQKRQPRLSLTIRNLKKTVSASKFLGNRK